MISVKKIKDEEILAALRNWAQLHGKPPTWEDWERASPEHPCAYTVRLRFGSWSAGLVRAGLKPGLKHPKKFDGEAVARLREDGISDAEIASRLGISKSSIYMRLGPRPKRKKPKNLKKRSREQRIADLLVALEKSER